MLLNEERIIRDNIDLNSFEFQADKAIEYMAELTGALLRAKKELVAPEQVVYHIANVKVQINILSYYYHIPLVNKMAKELLFKIERKNEKLKEKKKNEKQ